MPRNALLARYLRHGIQPFSVDGLSFRVEIPADQIDADLTVLQFMNYGERVSDHANLFIFYKGAKVKDGAAAVEEDDVTVVDSGGGAAGDGFFCFDIDGCFVGKRKGRVGSSNFDSAAVGTLEESVGGQLIKISSDGDLRDFEPCRQFFDIRFAGIGQSLEYRLFSFLKVHMIRLFLNKNDQ